MIVLSTIKDLIHLKKSYFIKVTTNIKLAINVTQRTHSKSIRSAVTGSVTPSAECFKNTAGIANFDRRHRWTWRTRGENNRNT